MATGTLNPPPEPPQLDPPPPNARRDEHAPPGRRFWLLMAISLVFVGATAYVQFARVDRARRGLSSSLGQDGLPVISELPPFSLTERSGRSVTLNDLSGTVWVADFVFTRCAGPCPVMTNRMAELQNVLLRDGVKGVQCVTISVDPETDTPAVLSEYAQMKNAHPSRWLFLTGDKKTIYDLAFHGFKVAVQDEADPDHQIIHSTRFVLVDKRGRVRGYYQVMTEDEEYEPRAAAPRMPKRILNDIMNGIQALLREPAA